jgi:hypothetical protein
MTHINTMAAPANSPTIGSAEPEVLYLEDPDVAELFAEVDAILCEALNPARCPPAPPATGCALMKSRSAGRSRGALARPRSAPVHPVRAVQRSPPIPRQLATTTNNDRVKGR